MWLWTKDNYAIIYKKGKTGRLDLDMGEGFNMIFGIYVYHMTNLCISHDKRKLLSKFQPENSKLQLIINN